MSEGVKLHTISQAARQIGVSAATLRRWANDGKIPVTVLPSGYRRFSDQQIEAIRRQITREPTDG